MSDGSSTPRVRIGDLLLRGGVISQDQLDAALAAQKKNGRRLGTNLLLEGLVSEDHLARVLSDQLGVRAVHLIRPTSERVLNMVSAELAAEHLVFPMDIDGQRVILAMADPSDVGAIRAVKTRSGLDVEPVVAPELVVSYAVRRWYGIKEAADETGELTEGPQFERRRVSEELITGDLDAD